MFFTPLRIVNSPDFLVRGLVIVKEWENELRVGFGKWHRRWVSDHSAELCAAKAVSLIVDLIFPHVERPGLLEFGPLIWVVQIDAALSRYVTRGDSRIDLV